MWAVDTAPSPSFFDLPFDFSFSPDKDVASLMAIFGSPDNNDEFDDPMDFSDFWFNK